jgi:hypothetical protein
LSRTKAKFSFELAVRPNYLLVAHVVEADRLVLANGVHRAVALLGARHDHAYCVLRHVSMGDLGSVINFSDPAFMKVARLLAPRPPLIRDFLDGDVSDEVAIADVVQFMRVVVQAEIGVLPTFND